MTFDFINDAKLQSLPAALRQRMQALQESRIANGHTADNGMTYRTKERHDHVNAVMAWQAAGKPSADLARLQAWEARLRAEGTW